jgi:ribosomal protein S6--L-glutamate ligase
MKIGILSRSSNIYSTKRLMEAARARGHEVDVIDTLKCYMEITSKKPITKNAFLMILMPLFHELVLQ